MEFNISPIDNRYRSISNTLSYYVSDYGINKIRYEVELKYLEFILNLLFRHDLDIDYTFTLEDFKMIKDIEKTTNHDIKALEYYIKDKLKENTNFDNKYLEFVHFGLTSQDINSMTNTISLKESINNVILPFLNSIVLILEDKANLWKDVIMISKTHGQSATTTSMGKEFKVYISRLKTQINQLNKYHYSSKFGGAVGNLNAHYFCYPDIHWDKEFNTLLNEEFNIKRNKYTTQIDHYDNLCEIFDILRRINMILLDFNQDIWLYISQDYFKLKMIKGEVGSSTMPHKVNPINFENSEGNIYLANSFLTMFSHKLPVSRLQRDLTDSTISRNFGSALSYCLIAYTSFIKGIDKLEINITKLNNDLDENWCILMEPVQTIMKTEFIENSYDIIKQISRGQTITKEIYLEIVNNLNITDSNRNKLLTLTPHTYLGNLINV
jgi:adenylosuccinate lyase